MATLAVADVHGELGAMRRLLARARPGPGDKVVFVGDLVGRGPDPAGVLREVASMGGRAEVVLGNHDLHMLHLHYAGGGRGHEVSGEADADELCDWLRRRPLAVALPHVPAVVVHAGAWRGWDAQRTVALAGEARAAFSAGDPGAAMERMHGDEAGAWDDGLAGGDRLQAIVNVLTRMRVCGPDGSIAWRYRGRPGEALPEGSARWYEVPGRALAGTLVVCGHWSTLGLTLTADVAMIDCGCCFGGPLAGLWVEDRRLVFSD